MVGGGRERPSPTTSRGSCRQQGLHPGPWQYRFLVMPRRPAGSRRSAVLFFASGRRRPIAIHLACFALTGMQCAFRSALTDEDAHCASRALTAVDIIQKPKRSPTVGLIVLRWRKPFANPALTVWYIS